MWVDIMHLGGKCRTLELGEDLWWWIFENPESIIWWLVSDLDLPPIFETFIADPIPKPISSPQEFINHFCMYKAPQLENEYPNRRRIEWHLLSVIQGTKECLNLRN